jgi:rSAM/selenodomain-associated transferase 2/rSAM/selenodomain-associated transferase 1
MIFDANSSILVLFCRRPSLGVGKQRIASVLGAQAALEAASLLLSAAVDDAHHWQGAVVVAPASPADSAWAQSLIPGATVIPQCKGNLGQRIQDVDQRIRERGGRNIVFIGSDAPGLTTAALANAAQALHTQNVVLAPASDGGVTLMGSSKPWPALADLPWESPQLGTALADECGSHGLSIALLPDDYDIDTRDDLLAALPALEADQRASRQRIAEWVRRTIGSRHSISVVVPVLNDIPALDALLSRIAWMGNEIDEVIVVDGDARPECQRLCEVRGAHYLHAGACRGQQLALGAQHSTGDILWFLHADSEPSGDAPGVIRQHVEQGFAGGYFRFRFLGEPRWQKELLQRLINLRTRFGIPYGDQGLFVRREAYTKSGGFAATPLFEEVGLIRKLRQQCKFAGVRSSIGVSPRRWERDGWLKRSLHNRWLAIAFMMGVPPEKLARHYPATKRSD